MIYVIYVFGGLFVAIAATMLYAFYLRRHFGLFLMGTTYATSGLLAISLSHWWPLAVGYVLVWMLKMLGLEPPVENKTEGDSRKSDETPPRSD